MGKYVRVVGAAGIRSAIHALKAEHRIEAQRHCDVLHYLRDHDPTAYWKVKACRTKARVARDRMTGRYKVRLYGCHVEPWCVACEHEAKWRRVGKVLERFQACTPDGRQPRFAHLVMTAPIFPNGKGWGRFAKEDPRTFRELTWKVTRQAYGDGAGAYMTYQDFGERAFAKTHPHLDFTVNGWSLGTDRPVLTPMYSLKAGGSQRWMESVRREVVARWLLPDEEAVTNLNIQAFITGARDYARILAYQLRGLVDARKMTYDRPRQLVYWSSYRDNTRVRMTVQEFHDGLADYQRRLGAFGEHQAKTLHVGMGHLADRRIKTTAKLMDSVEPDHRRSCICHECGDWELVHSNDCGEYDPWALDLWQAEAPTTAM
jgi:hypothetical protein